MKLMKVVKSRSFDGLRPNGTRSNVMMVEPSSTDDDEPQIEDSGRNGNGHFNTSKMRAIT